MYMYEILVLLFFSFISNEKISSSGDSIKKYESVILYHATHSNIAAAIIHVNKALG